MLTFIGWQKGPAASPLAMSKWWIHSNNSMLFQAQSTYTIMMSQWSLSISQTISYCGTCPLQLVVQIRFVNRHIPIMWIAHRTSAPHVDNNLFTRAGVAQQHQYGQAAMEGTYQFFPSWSFLARLYQYFTSMVPAGLPCMLRGKSVSCN